MKRNSVFSQILPGFCLMLAIAAAAQADTWNITNDWATANTAGSPWKFYQAARGSTPDQFIQMSALSAPLWDIYNGWEGQSYSTSAFMLMNEGDPYYVNGIWTIPNGVVTSMTGVGSDGVNPVALNAVAAWVSPVNGTVSLSGSLLDEYNDGSANDDGIDWILGTSTGGVLSSGTILPGGSTALSAEDITVAAGDMIYVMMDPRNSAVADITEITMEISEVPEPATMGLLAIGGLVGLLRKRK